jgi:DNA-directed RNA polymerase specialized sigma24 family protein
VALSREELVAIWTRLPPRSVRRMEGEEVLRDQPAETERPEGRILEGELAQTRSRVAAALTRAFESLTSDDRLLVEMSILRSWKVSEVARVLQLDQRRLYRRIEGICKELKKRLEAEGLGWEQVKDLLNRKDLRW